jgi:hypothetical protein
MSQLRDFRIAEKTAVILFACISLSGCTVLRTIPLKDTMNFPQNRFTLIIHADDSLWTVQSFVVSENDLAGQIVRHPVKFPRSKVSHVYAAPLSAIKIEGSRLTVPKVNIAKVDYYATDLWSTIGCTLFLATLVITFMPLLFY